MTALKENSIDYTHLGRSGLKVSRLALGTMNFGWVTDEAAAFSIMDEALEQGINLFDTADVYGGPQTPDMEQGFGISEEIIGRWLAQGGGRRERVVLATKLYQPMGTVPNDRHLSAYHIRKACEDSLRRLQTDHIDVYQMHHIDRSTPWEEILQAMEQLVREGKVLYVGEIPKVVFSKTLQYADWPDTRIARGDLAEEIGRLKREPGNDLIAYGGATLDQALSRLGLVDEYRLMVQPAALGAGLPLFKDLPAALHLELVEATTYSTGLAIHVYRPRSSPAVKPVDPDQPERVG
jgi:dihydrofolate reductase